MAFAPRFLLLALALGSTALAQEIPPEANRPVTSPGNAVWATTGEEARARAAADGKLVFIELESPECGNCQRMDNLLYPAFDFEALLIGMVPVKLNLESTEGAEISARYEISQTPAILITSPEGRLVFRMEGFLNAPDFYRHAQQDLDSYRQFARRVEAQDIPKLTSSEALETGRELYQRADPAAALPRLKRVLAHPKAAQVERDEAREILAAVELDMGQPKASRQTIDRLIATTKNPERRQRAELFRAQIPLSENKPAEAIVLFKKFRKDHPNSPHIARVDEILERLGEAERNR